MIQVQIFTLCKKVVNYTDGHLDLIGIQDVFFAPAVPAIARDFSIVAKVRYDEEDYGTKIAIRIVDSDGNEIAHAEATHAFPEGKTHFLHSFDVPQLPLHHFGDYSIDLLHAGETIFQSPLQVRLRGT